MIPFNLSQNQTKELEEEYWTWFENNILKDFIKKLKGNFNDSDLLKAYFDNIDDLSKIEKIKEFVLLSPDKLSSLKQYNHIKSEEECNEFIERFRENIDKIFNISTSNNISSDDLKKLFKYMATYEIYSNNITDKEIEVLYKSKDGNSHLFTQKNIKDFLKNNENKFDRGHLYRLKNKDNYKILNRNINNFFNDNANLKKEMNINSLYDKVRKDFGYNIIKALDIHNCPYCNKNYLEMYEYSNNKLKFNGQLDHYYPKSQYPFFAVCLYNLIPCCPICNQLKSDSSDKENFNPYNNEHKIEDYKFEFHFEDIPNMKVDKITMDTDKEFIKGSIEKFHLKERYETIQTKDYVNKIIEKIKIYPDSQQDEILNIFNKNDNKLSKSELKEHIFGAMKKEDIKNKSLGKLHYDLLKGYGIM